MGNYCLIENGEILEGPKLLPTNYKNISNLPSLSDEDLKLLGWLPVSYPELVFDPAVQNRLEDTYVIQDTVVEVVFNFVDKTQEELDTIAAAEAEAIATAYIAERAAAHLPTGDQLDMQYWDLINGTTVWRDYVTALKLSIPKPE